MSAIVKIFPSNSRAPRYLEFIPEEGVTFAATRELHGMAVSVSAIFEAKEKVSLSMGRLSTDNFHALVSLNPHVIPFVSNATYASTWNPNTTAPLHVSFTVTKALDLSTIGPLLYIHLLD